MSRYPFKTAALLLVALSIASPIAVRAQSVQGDSWTERKCVLYTAAWKRVVGDERPAGVSEEFVSEHDAFLASGCLDRGRVCPRSPRELEIADILSLMAVSEGMAGSFLPFDCSG